MKHLDEDPDLLDKARAHCFEDFYEDMHSSIDVEKGALDTICNYNYLVILNHPEVLHSGSGANEEVMRL